MLPLDVVVNSKAPTSDFIGRFFGGGASLFVSFCAVVSAFGCLNGWVLLAGELPAAMAARGALPAWFGARNAPGVPYRPLLLCAGITAVLLVLANSRTGIGAFNFVALISTATSLVLYLLCILAAVRFMHDGRMPRTPGMALATGGALLFSACALYFSGAEALLYGAGLVALGWPLHRLAQRLAQRLVR